MNNFKLLVFTTLLLIGKTGFAQSSAVTSAWNYMRYEQYDKALPYIEDASKHEGTKDEPKTWLYRGQIFEKIAVSKKPEIQKLSTDPIGEALNSYVKCIDLDPKKRYSDEAAASLQSIMILERNAGAEAYNKLDFAGALPYFEKYNTAKGGLEKYANKYIADTAVMYYIAYCNYSIKNTDKAKVQFIELMDKYKYADGNLYASLSDIYLDEKDTAQALKVLDAGLANANARGKINIQISHFNLLSKQGKYAQAIQDGQALLASAPDNISIYKALGVVYQKAGKIKEAQDLYDKLYAKDPNDFDVNELIGQIYYTQGYDIYTKSMDEKDEKKADKMEKESDVYFKKSIPYFETAHKVKPEDEQLKKILGELYLKTGDKAKADALKSGK